LWLEIDNNSDMFSSTGSDPETSFSLTSSEFKAVEEALATYEQKIT